MYWLKPDGDFKEYVLDLEPDTDSVKGEITINKESTNKTINDLVAGKSYTITMFTKSDKNETFVITTSLTSRKQSNAHEKCGKEGVPKIT